VPEHLGFEECLRERGAVTATRAGWNAGYAGDELGDELLARAASPVMNTEASVGATRRAQLDDPAEWSRRPEQRDLLASFLTSLGILLLIACLPGDQHGGGPLVPL